MVIRDLFSNRDQPESHDVYEYDELPQRLRGQTVHIMKELFDFIEERSACLDLARWIHGELCREYGVQYLHDDRLRSQDRDLESFLLHTARVPFFLDALELFLRGEWIPKSELDPYWINGILDGVLEEINKRFLRAAVGYQFSGGKFIRVDNTYTHQEMVLPALRILAHDDFEGPNEEYRNAHQYYRNQDYSTCVTECCKAFESTMKVICDQKGWAYDKHTDTAKKLVAILKKNELFPSYLQHSLTNLAAFLEGTATVRNKQSSHGQGATPIPVAEEFASFCLHSTAANIILLSKLAGYRS